MKNIQTRIEEQVDVFVGNLQQLISEAATEAVGQALGSSSRGKARRRPSKRRREEDIAALTEELYRAICRHPGASMRTLGETVRRPTRELSLCAHRLIDQRRVKKAGQRDQTRYFPIDARAKRVRRTKR